MLHKHHSNVIVILTKSVVQKIAAISLGCSPSQYQWKFKVYGDPRIPAPKNVTGILEGGASS